jgi:hypothetical protein
MGQKESHANKEQISEYYQRRHSFMDNMEERKAKFDSQNHSNSRHKKAKSKDLTAFKNASKSKHGNRQEEVILSILAHSHAAVCDSDDCIGSKRTKFPES